MSGWSQGCCSSPHSAHSGPTENHPALSSAVSRGDPAPSLKSPGLALRPRRSPGHSPGPLMLHPALRLRCHSSVSTATLPSRTHSAPQNSGHEAAHAAFPLLGPSPRMRQKNSFVFFAPKVVPLRVFLSQAGYPKTFQAFMPSSLLPQIQDQPAHCADLAAEGHLESNHMGRPIPHCLAPAPVPSPRRSGSTPHGNARNHFKPV